MEEKLITKRENKYGKGLTKEEYREKYPQIAEALEELFNTKNKKRYYAQQRLSYEGHLNAKGERRRLTIQSAVDILEEVGYTVDIKVKKPKG